ncbi:MAG: hypothetical protein A3H68_03760 [Candidatus Taylorbacteria bacterium RIFCSPLOWO2_02_FULL_46_40]|uniref:Uncharacterized protein n=1 Tax=Candidatus Taylorbacteria bacterium RIFCSPLOWO2_02_FULL_46_40 TaxID=1802329 RepID=A0A1G2NV79_9BACT|nr:MAG: hypothetical protein A3H68_03760 [Candidatus Taylorbacteria bacterium RIFCSPLOWO2_02_FULL_46_40]
MQKQFLDAVGSFCLTKPREMCETLTGHIQTIREGGTFAIYVYETTQDAKIIELNKINHDSKSSPEFGNFMRAVGEVDQELARLGLNKRVTHKKNGSDYYIVWLEAPP